MPLVESELKPVALQRPVVGKGASEASATLVRVRVRVKVRVRVRVRVRDRVRGRVPYMVLPSISLGYSY